MCFKFSKVEIWSSSIISLVIDHPTNLKTLYILYPDVSILFIESRRSPEGTDSDLLYFPLH